MSILTSKKYYLFSKILAIGVFPGFILLLFFFKVEKKVVAKGVIESNKQVIIRSPVKDTIVKKIYYESGDYVKKGDKILEFYDLPGYHNKINKTIIQLKALKTKLANLQTLKQSGGVADADIKDLEYQLKTLQTQLQEYQEKHQLFVIRAPFTGRIIKFYVEQYEKAAIGAELLTLSAESNKIIRCLIPENQYTYLKNGQPVRIKSQLYNYLKHDIYKGVLERISQFGSLKDNVVYYEAIIEIKEGTNRLRLNSQAICEIITGYQPLWYFIFQKE